MEEGKEEKRKDVENTKTNKVSKANERGEKRANEEDASPIDSVDRWGIWIAVERIGASDGSTIGGGPTNQTIS